MEANPTGHTDPGDSSESGLHLVCLCRNPQQAHDLGLTLLAADLAYWVMPDPNGFALMVESSDVESICHLLSAPSGIQGSLLQPERVPTRSGVGAIAAFWSLIAAISLLATTWAPEIIPRGGLLADGILQGGEWWRPATALTLHADIGHLAANLVAGVFVTLALAQRIGGANAVLGTLGAGILGNILAALIRHQSTILSIGASTAVFGALGVLCALPGVLRHLGRSRVSWIPLATGVVVLGIYGSGDAQTDVLAHITGFAAGWLIGRTITIFRRNSRSEAGINEVTRAILACMVPLLAWLWALWT
jgi:membrane associated rhomboid family serine protease